MRDDITSLTEAQMDALAAGLREDGYDIPYNPDKQDGYYKSPKNYESGTSTKSGEYEPAFAPFRPFEKAVKSDLPPFPLDALTARMQDYIGAVAKSFQVTADMVAVPALAFVSVAARRNFSVNPNADWLEPLNLYAVTAADASERKTGVMNTLLKPLESFEKDWNRDVAPIVDEYKNKLEMTEAKIAVTKKKIANGNADFKDLSDLTAELRNLKENPERFLRLTCADATPEALERLLVENGGVIALVSDEGGILSMITGGRYSDVRNLDTLLKAYSVNGPAVQIDRKGASEPIRIERPCVALNLMCQPRTVRELTQDDEFNQRGLTARFLYAFPETKVGTRTARSVKIPETNSGEWAELIQSILKRGMNGSEPRIIHFSEEAAVERDKWFDEIESDLAEMDSENPLRAWLGKLDGQTARIAGLLHLCDFAIQHSDCASIALTAKTYRNAVKIARYFLAHAEYAFSLSGASMTESERDALYIWKRLSESGKTRIGKRDLNRLCQRFKKAEEMDAGLTELVTRGYIRVLTESAARGRPSVTIEINPEIN